MSLFSRITNFIKNNNKVNSNKMSFMIDNFFPTRKITNVGEDLSEITYFTCLRILSETVAKVKIELVDDSFQPVDDSSVYNVLNIKANQFMTPFTWEQVVVFHMYHFGNSYSYIQYDDNGNLKALIPLDPRYVTIYIDNMKIFKDRNLVYQYIDQRNGDNLIFLPEEILHFKGGISEDGISGQCIRYTLASTLRGNKLSQEILNSMYESGMTPSAVLEYTGDLSTKKRAELTKVVSELMSKDVNDSRIIPLPLGMSLKPIDIKFSDAEFSELKQYTSSQIAAAFGLPNSMLNDYKNSTHFTSEASSLIFYTQTIQPLFTKIEQELNAKLLNPDQLKNRNEYKFRIRDMIVGDSKTHAEVLKSYVSSGIYSINDARRELSLPSVPGGDMHIINGAGVSISDGKLVKDISESSLNKNESKDKGGDQENE